MRNWRKAIAAILSAVSLLLVAGCGSRAAGKVTVEVLPVSEGAITTDLEITGVLAPNRTVNIFSKLAGVVDVVGADVGDRVAAGQLLLQIDTRELNAQLEQAQAAVRVAKSQAEDARIGIEAARVELDLAQKTCERIKKLADAGAASPSQLDEAQSRLEGAGKKYQDFAKKYEAANNTIAVQQAAAGVISAQISNSRITSPIGGVVTNRNINPGELASPGVPLLTVADVGVLKLQGMVSQEAVPLLSVGQEVKVAVDALPGRSFVGRISRVGPVAATTGQYFPVEVSVSGGSGLVAGMTARATIRITGPKGVVVPLAAVKTGDGQSCVFVVSRGRAVLRPVRLGLRGNEEVMVLQGLRPGEQVAVSNVGALQDGMAVAAVPAKKC
ncbi:MAG: efflux RND transporter periplasmic adaptor subunit [Bacillota bacterium]|jgi:RND family efflux transporter MFP subunit|nr:efflux RND transporter periplasmic adaptor subunit [Bacillota bacterium]